MIYPILTDKAMRLPVFLTGIGIKSPIENIDRKHGYQDYQISLITKGRGAFETGAGVVPLEKGSFFYFERHIPHRYYSQGRDFCNKWVCFNGNDLTWLSHLMQGEQSCVFQNACYPRYSNMFDRLYAEVRSEKAFGQERASALLYSLIMEFLSLKDRQTHLHETNQRMKYALEYMEAHHSKAISLEEISGEIGVSKYILCKAFKQVYGISVFSYLLKYRLQQAKSLLIETDMSVKEIGHTVGFNDISYFIMTFRKHEHITPENFRKNF